MAALWPPRGSRVTAVRPPHRSAPAKPGDRWFGDGNGEEEAAEGAAKGKAEAEAEAEAKVELGEAEAEVAGASARLERASAKLCAAKLEHCRASEAREAALSRLSEAKAAAGAAAAAAGAAAAESEAGSSEEDENGGTSRPKGTVLWSHKVRAPPCDRRVTATQPPSDRHRDRRVTVAGQVRRWRAGLRAVRGRCRRALVRRVTAVQPSRSRRASWPPLPCNRQAL